LSTPKNLNHKYWVGLEGDVVKIKKFKHAKKKKWKKGIILQQLSTAGKCACKE
jgi:hypothetical protein